MDLFNFDHFLFDIFVLIRSIISTTRKCGPLTLLESASLMADGRWFSVHILNYTFLSALHGVTAINDTILFSFNG